MTGHALKFGRIRPGVAELWEFKFRGVCITPNIQRPLAMKLCMEF